MIAPPCQTSGSDLEGRLKKPMPRFDSGKSQDWSQDTMVSVDVLVRRLKQSDWPESVRSVVGRTIRESAANGKTVNAEELAEGLEDLPLEAQVSLSVWADILAELLPEVFSECPQSKWPTAMMPGTMDKLILLKRRVKGGFNLWHPKDQTNA